MKDERYKTISSADIDKQSSEVERIWKGHLQRFEVKLPKTGTWRRTTLAILLAVKDRFGPEAWIHKDDISELIRRESPEAGSDQQVRHLKRQGWNLETKGPGFHRIADPYRPSSEWESDSVRRNALSTGDFEAIKKAYNLRCATCGAIEGEPDPRYGSGDKVQLQQGHMDPEKPLGSGNMIPQCQFCNRAYKNFFTFDDKGRVHAVASEEPVRRASVTVQKHIHKWLMEKFGLAAAEDRR